VREAIIKLDENFQASYDINLRYKVKIEPVWSSEYDGNNFVDELEEYEINITTGSKDCIVDTYYMSASYFGDEEIIYVTDEDTNVEYKVNITLVSDNTFKIQVKKN
jgi:hypothetical protein